MRPLAAGRSADVFDLGGGRILRRYHDRARSAEREAKVVSWAGAHGVPVPEVFDVAGPDIVMEKVDGPTMLADLARRPWRLLRHAARLARLHQQVHRVPALDGLRAPFGDGRALLHLDLHPDNVLLSPRGPVLIAWTQLFGMISFELFGQLVGSADPADAFFGYSVDQMADFIGLP